MGKVNYVEHNKIKVRSVGDGEIAQSSDNTSDADYIWHDLDGWVDIVVTYDADVGAGDTNLDFDIDAHISPHGAYELNNSITEDTGDYTTLSLASGITAGTLARVDSDDVDDLKHPIRSIRFKITNNDADENLAMNLWVEGQG